MTVTDERDGAAGEGDSPPMADPAAALGAIRVSLPESKVQVGPLGHLAAERRRLSDLTWERFDVTPVAATIGAVVSGIDIAADLDDDTIAELREAWLAYKVLFFREQTLTGADHVGFARRFGELEVHPFIPGNEEYPELVRFEKSADTGGYENGWHSDVTWRERPSMGAILRAVQVPATGGDTLFSDVAAAYEGLSTQWKQRVDGLTATHDYSLAFGHHLDAEAKAEMNRKYPQVAHPVVRTHPETDAKLLYVNRFFTSHIDGVSAAESREIIEHLSDQAAIAEYQARFRWEPDSVAFWDNRAVQHYAASDYWPDVRIMERASIIGDRPR